MAKHRRSSFRSSMSHTSTPLYRIHSDVWGPAPQSSLKGRRYFVIFVDEASRYTWTYLLAAKSGVTSTVRHFCTMVKTQFGRGIQRFRSDNTRDFVNAELASFFADQGILHETSYVATPEQNGMAERRIGYVTSTACTLLLNYHVLWSYWGEAILTSTHLVNQLPSPTLAFTSPIDRLHAAFPGISVRTSLLPRIFGCTAYVHDSSGSQTKLDARALRCVFVGYSSLQKGYKCYHPSSRRFFVSANVTFAEYEPFFGVCSTSSRLPLDKVPLTSPLVLLSPLGSPEPSSFSTPPTSSPPLEPVVERRVDPPPSIPSLLPSDELASPPSGDLPSSSSSDLLTSPPVDPPSSSGDSSSVPGPISDVSPPPSSPSPTNDDDDLHWPIAFHKGVRQCTRTPRYPLSHYLSFDRLTAPYQLFLTRIESDPIPRRKVDAIASPHWKAAMDEEMHSLLKNHTLDVVPLPFGKTAVGCKWFHTKKHHADGTLERYKSRLVARGFTQSYGIDYFETFAPVAKMETARLLLALAAHFQWVIRQFDVKNAFLHGDLTEEVYMQHPPRYSLGPPGTVCRLRKSLYGLKQSPRMWFGRFSSVMKAEGYVHSNGDSSLFVRHCLAGVSIHVVYVDDILITGSNVMEASRLSAALAHAFKIKALGPLQYFLGLEVAYSPRGIFVSQQHYTVDLLKLTGMTDCAPVRTHIDPNVKLGDGGDSPPVNHYQYQQLVGKLIYLTQTRPDISFVVHLLSQFMHAPHEIHRQAAHRVLAYLKGCPGKGLLFPRSADETVKVYTDVDFAGSIVDCRSTTGYCTFVFGSLVIWKSSKQDRVSRSSAEVEYRPLADGASEAQWLHGVLSDLRVRYLGPIHFFCDNKSTIALAKNPGQTG